MSRITHVVPNGVLGLFFSDWPAAQKAVLRSFIRSPTTVYAALSMAHEEMNTIKELDQQLLKTHQHKLYMYFAEEDGWVGKHKEKILQTFHPVGDAVKTVHGHPDIPHSFCISKPASLALSPVLIHCLA